jgi:CheY-like chemotaxis protein
MYRLGYIDEDAGQRNQFRQTFKEDFEVYLVQGYEGVGIDELIIEAFDNHIDLLVIDYEMEEFYGYNGDAIARKISLLRPNFPVIIFTSHESDALDFVDNANIVNGKDIWSGDHHVELEVFKKKLSSLINSHKNKIVEVEKKLEELETKKNETGLQPNEEDQYVELNNFLDKSFEGGEHLSRTFYSENTNKRLDAIIAKTEELINKLPN